MSERECMRLNEADDVFHRNQNKRTAECRVLFGGRCCCVVICSRCHTIMIANTRTNICLWVKRIRFIFVFLFFSFYFSRIHTCDLPYLCCSRLAARVFMCARALRTLCVYMRACVVFNFSLVRIKKSLSWVTLSQHSRSLKQFFSHNFVFVL